MSEPESTHIVGEVGGKSDPVMQHQGVAVVAGVF